MAGPGIPAGDGRLRASHADRDRVIAALKDAFVDGCLTRDELDTRAGQALAAKTGADLAALTADLPPASARPAPVPSRPVPARPSPAADPAPARRRPLLRAAVQAVACVALAFGMVLIAFLFDPDGPRSNPHHGDAKAFLALAFVCLIMGFGAMANGVACSVEQRRARRLRLSRPGGPLPRPAAGPR